MPITVLVPKSVKVTTTVAVSCVIALIVILPLPSICEVQFVSAFDNPKVFKAEPLAANV